MQVLRQSGDIWQVTDIVSDDILPGDIWPVPDWARGAGVIVTGEDGHPRLRTAEETAALDAQEQQARQLAKSERQKGLENSYLKLCDQVAGNTDHTKLGFEELKAGLLAIPDTTTAINTALYLLALNDEMVYLAGVGWWDNCVWHPEVEQ